MFPTISARFANQTSFDAFSSKDMKTWTKHPRILTTNEVSWAKDAMWAPDAHEVGGRYYGHHSVICAPGNDDWYICYHRRPIPSEGRDHRIVCIDRMEFDANGDIKPVVMMANPASR